MAVGDWLDSAELELLLPWHATGTLSNREAGSIELGLAALPALARQLRRIQCERIDIVRAGESLGRPSDRPFARLLAAVNGPCAAKRRTLKVQALAASLAVDLFPGSSGE